MKRQPKMEAVAVTGFLALCLLVSSADRPLAEGAGPVKETTGPIGIDPLATSPIWTDLVYDTLRSTVRNDFLSLSTVCLESDDGPNTTAVDATVPSVGQVFYYATRAQNACPNGEGPLGPDSQGNPRQGRACP